MSFVLSKLLFFLIKPLIWVLALLCYSLFAKNKLRKRNGLIAAVVLLLFFSNAWIFNQFAKVSEAAYPPLKHYDYGILLGGFSGINPINNEIAFGSAGDRILQTIALYKKGIIDKILVSSGNADLFNNDVKEADLAFDYLRKIGIPDSAIVVENQSRNTKENLLYSFKLLDKIKPKASILVITSAWHIPRTKLIAKKQHRTKLDFYPTNHISKADMSWYDYAIPDAAIMGLWGVLIKEWVGYVVTKLGIT